MPPCARNYKFTVLDTRAGVSLGHLGILPSFLAGLGRRF